MNENVISPSEEDIDARESRRSRWFFIVFFVALFLSIAMTFYRTFVARNYDVIIETVCDPYVSVCFARDICETEDGTCGEGDVLIETEHYKIVNRKAFAFPEKCAADSLENEKCADLSCRADESECSETFCSEDVVPEGERCLGPGVVIEIGDSENADSEREDVNENNRDEMPNENVSSEEGEVGEGEMTAGEKEL